MQKIKPDANVQSLNKEPKVEVYIVHLQKLSKAVELFAKAKFG